MAGTRTLSTALSFATLLAFGAGTASADTRDEHRNHAIARTPGAARAEAARPQVQDRHVARPQSETRTYAVPRESRVSARAVEPARPYSNDRPYDGRRYDYDRRSYPAPRYYSAPRYYAPRYYGPRYYVAPRIYVPRLYRPGLSIGIFFGTPFPYRWAYPVPVPVYGYPALAPGAAYGGISFAIYPPDAAVYVDGTYMGVAADFDGVRQPLTLAAGQHRVELQAPGYVPMMFDAVVSPGQVMPYRGSLQPY